MSKQTTTMELKTKVDCMPGFKKEEAEFKNHILPNGKPYPYQKRTEQIRYEKWVAKVWDSFNNIYNTDWEGTGKCKVDGKGPKQYIRTITRIRRADNSQYLYSYGNIIGFNSFGDPQRTPCDKPEVWTRTTF